MVAAHSVATLDTGCAAMHSVMWQNMRCSILFHFDVPGGKCETLCAIVTPMPHCV